MKNIIKLILVFMIVPSLLSACSSKNNDNSNGNREFNNGTASGIDLSNKNSVVITDYYNEDGTFSSLGLALDEEDTEKVLYLSEGDTFIIDDHIYSVKSESLKLIFYTQNSLDDVILWWLDCADRWVESGFVSELG
ncbi:MAG: hypothetical protein FWH40_02535 [Coriobacteriia bacterium]|nr:hypothetical protein [Coriobacteriia bacterium]